MPTFEEQLAQCVQQSVLKLIREGNFIQPDYANRPKLPAAPLHDLYASIDWVNVKSLVLADLERRAADHILNSMATEIATDVKQVLSNKELREEVRAFIRKGINSIGEKITAESVAGKL